MSDSLFGSQELSLGPAYFYWDTASGSANDIDMGETGPIIFRFGVEKTDLTTIQNGTGPADKIVTTAMAQLEVDFAQHTLERMANVIQGFKLKRDGAGVITGYSFARPIGQRDSDIWKQATLVRISNGANSTATFDTVEFWKLAPASNTEFTFDAATQRFCKVVFEAYADSAHPDTDGRPTFFGSGVIS